MCRFPVYSNGQRTISLWFDNSVQEGDGPILLIVLHCKPYGRVNTVYVLKEALLIDFLVDDKGVIYIHAPELGGWGQYLGLFALSTPCIDWLLWDLQENPWQHPQPVHRTGLGKRSMCV